MALHRTKDEKIRRYTEGWPQDLIPSCTRDLSALAASERPAREVVDMCRFVGRHANFDSLFKKRKPYEAGDGVEDWMLLAWGNGGSGRTGTGDLCSSRVPRWRSAGMRRLRSSTVPRWRWCAARD